MVLGIMVAADVVAGAVAAWSSGVAWTRDSDDGLVFRFVQSMTYLASLLCLTFPLILGIVELLVRNRAVVRPDATIASVFLASVAMVLALALGLLSAREGR